MTIRVTATINNISITSKIKAVLSGEGVVQLVSGIEPVVVRVWVGDEQILEHWA